MTRPLGTPMGEMEFLGWLGQAEAGEVLVYHRGFLAVDRHWAEGGALDRLADRAAWAAEHGLADLLQRRHGPEDLSYLAIARQRTTSLSRLIGSETP